MIQHKNIYLILIILITSSCNGQGNKNSIINKEFERIDTELTIKEKIEYGAGDVTTYGFLDNSGNMWFTTLTEGVFKYDGKIFTNLTQNDGLCSNSVNAVIQDKNGLLWFATSKGLCSYNGKTFNNYPLPQEHVPSVSPKNGLASSKTEVALSLIQDNKGIFWIGTNASGAYSFDGEKFTSFLRYSGRIHPDYNVYNNCIQSIVEDDSGNIWFTSQTHGGISRFDGERFTHFTKEDGLSDDMIFSSFKDKDGNLWFGTLDNGLILYSEGSFKFFNETDGLNNNMVSSFYQDKTGKLWIGSFRESTISWFDGKKFTSVPFDNAQNLIEIRFITEDNEGYIWFGGRYGILWRYDGNELKDYTQLKNIM